MNRVRKILNIDLLHERGYKGKGVGIAVLDTGVVPHLDLNDNIADFKDFVNQKNSIYDDNGHGTHVAGIIAGKGIKSNGIYKGIAPDSHIVMLKCLDKDGNGSITDASEAIDYIIKKRNQYRIRIVNISIGSVLGKDRKENQVLIHHVEMLWKIGFVVIVAAGNNGPKSGSVTVPGCAKSVITVGAYDDHAVFGRRKNGHFLNYSGRGPTGSCVRKPEIVCPGTNIISCSVNGKNYSSKSGTSMSAPIVAGVTALMLEKYPEYSNKDVKKRMYETAIDLGYDKNHQGWGLLNPLGLLQEV